MDKIDKRVSEFEQFISDMLGVDVEVLKVDASKNCV